MCHALLCIILETFVVGFALFGNLNRVWKNGDTVGGIWSFCPSDEDVKNDKHNLPVESEDYLTNRKLI